MYQITSEFMQNEGFRQGGHLGIDFAMEEGTPLRSLKKGVVDKVVNYGDVNIGKGVLVRWEDGFTAIYGHMSEITVRAGDIVSQSSLLGYSGNTGNVVGANGGYHLHFGLKNVEGVFVDPAHYTFDIQSMNLGMSLDNIPPAPVEYLTENLANDMMNVYQQLMDNLKIEIINFANILTSMDYTVFVQYLEYPFELFTR